VLERIEFVVKKLFKFNTHFIENKRVIIFSSGRFIQNVRFFSLFLKLVMREHNCSINKIVYNLNYDKEDNSIKVEDIFQRKINDGSMQKFLGQSRPKLLCSKFTLITVLRLIFNCEQLGVKGSNPT